MTTALFGDDELSCDFLAYGHADIHAVGQRPVVGDLGVDLHLSVFVDRRVDRNDASLHFFAQIGERRDCNLLPPAELSVLGFEDGEADVEAPVVEQRTEFALGIFIEMLLHIRDLTGKMVRITSIVRDFCERFAATPRHRHSPNGCVPVAIPRPER